MHPHVCKYIFIYFSLSLSFLNVPVAHGALLPGHAASPPLMRPTAQHYPVRSESPYIPFIAHQFFFVPARHDLFGSAATSTGRPSARQPRTRRRLGATGSAARASASTSAKDGSVPSQLQQRKRVSARRRAGPPPPASLSICGRWPVALPS